ncbi:MAG: hypothetical protein IJR47_03285 [Clostridia bacterium]|nr:hypothetical protein [Clostridia bacterium]
MKSQNLTFLESVMLVAGSGIGTGILTIPYAVEKVGVFGALISIAFAFIASAVLYMFIAELTLGSKDSTQILGILKEHLFKGKRQKILTNIFFVVLVIVLLENLIVYILCAANIISELLNISMLLSKIIFYALASLVILFGIKGVGIGEKFSVSLMTGAIILLMALSVFGKQREISLAIGESKLILALFGLFMFAFSAIFSVIQVTNNIDNKKNVKKALMLGLVINAGLTFLFSCAAIIGSKEVTEVATIGLARTINKPWVTVLCSAFVLLAMFTSYWSSGLAFADIIEEQFKLNKRLSWLISTIPTIILASVFPLSILDYVQIGAGALSIVIGIIILPAYYNAVKNSNRELLLGKLGYSKTLIGIEGVCIFVMAVSSFIEMV